MTYPIAAMTSQRATSTNPRIVKTNQTTSMRSYKKLKKQKKLIESRLRSKRKMDIR